MSRHLSLCTVQPSENTDILVSYSPGFRRRSSIENPADSPDSLGIELTEGHMMDPEGSVSALVFHHPDAKYFNLSEQDIDRLEQAVANLK